jgi:hypothetical protein
MGRDRRRAATGRGSRWSRKLHTLERLEPRCVLNGTAPWIAPPAPTLVSQGRADVVASGFVSGPSSDFVDRLGELDQYANHGTVGSPFLDGRNDRSLTPIVDGYGSKSGSPSAYNASLVDGMTTWSTIKSPIVEVVIVTPRSVLTSFYNAQTGMAISSYEHVGESSPSGGQTKAPSSAYSASLGRPDLAPASDPASLPEVGQHSVHQQGLDPAGATQTLGSASYGLAATTPISTPSVASATQSQSSLDLGTAAQAARSVVADSSAAGQFNSAVLTVVRNSEPLSGVAVGQSVSTLNVDVQSSGNTMPIGPRSVSNSWGRSTGALPLVRALPQGGIVQLPDGKAALADMPLDMRRMEQALETVVSEVKLIGPEVARWLDGIHVTPLTVAIAAAAVASGSVYYLRRRSTRRADRPEDEASSSWLFARLQPTPE